MKKVYILWIMVALLVPVTFIACASIIKGGTDTLNVRSTPDQADVSITDEANTVVHTGKTPTVVTLNKKAGYFSGKKYTVKVTKAGFPDSTTVVDTHANGWYIGGNIIFGGLIGWFLVDPLTGAMWSLDTTDLNVDLQNPPPPKEGSELEKLQFHVMLLQDVPVTLRINMVRISE